MSINLTNVTVVSDDGYLYLQAEVAPEAEGVSFVLMKNWMADAIGEFAANFDPDATYKSATEYQFLHNKKTTSVVCQLSLKLKMPGDPHSPNKEYHKKWYIYSKSGWMISLDLIKLDFLNHVLHFASKWPLISTLTKD